MVVNSARQVFLGVSIMIFPTTPEYERFGNPGEHSRGERLRLVLGLQTWDNILRLFVGNFPGNRAAREGCLVSQQSGHAGGWLWMRKVAG